MRTMLKLFGLAVLFAACKGGAEASGTAGEPVSGLVRVVADDKGFTPSSVAFKKGAPASLVFTRTSDDTCAKEVVFPEIKLTKELPLHTPVTVDVPTGDARTLTFQCGMGMFKGKVRID